MGYQHFDRVIICGIALEQALLSLFWGYGWR
jgi:hypothetical protein